LGKEAAPVKHQSRFSYLSLQSKLKFFMPNRLINSTSPYLLQHAENPVDWYPWGSEALEKARKEDKPILLSVGYSACHWCHVMEKECFENETVAGLMNERFVNIKVDREERPDIDQLYMDALHLMGQRGGWPMHVFLTPDQLPFYGGTYFPAENWMRLLYALSGAYATRREEIRQTGLELQQGLQVNEISRYASLPGDRSLVENPVKLLEKVVAGIKATFDPDWGGFGQAPKFPMPCVYDFLLFYHHLSEDSEVLEMLTLSLGKMAFGGIHDQLAGGFARYSVDGEWKVPHFEKMLYDNAQLLSLYSHAFGATLDILYRDVALDLVRFVKNELTSPEGAFYSALDADSEGEEGKYYVWTRQEILDILGEAGEDFCSFFRITESGNFEDGKNVLWRTLSEEDFALLTGNRSHPEMHKYVVECKRKLLSARSKRVKPGLDDKVLTSWNAMMVKGLADAYRAFDEPDMLRMAYENASFIRENLMEESGRLFHTWKSGKASVEGFLEDYAFTIEAFLAMYESTFHEDWLHQAIKIADYTLAHFSDSESNLFFFTSAASEDQLIARKKEIMDNVIPSSNSVLAMGLLRLGALSSESRFSEAASGMIREAEPLLLSEGRYMSHWLQVWMMGKFPLVEIAFVGRYALKFKKEVDKIFFPNKVVAGTTSSSSLPLLQNRSSEGYDTQVFVCRDRVCRLPAHNIPGALRQLKLLKQEMMQPFKVIEHG
jgi:uncharacterized protein YyaL (SSP411 family)